MGDFGIHGGESPVTRALGRFGLGGDASPRPAVDTRVSLALPPGPGLTTSPCPGLGARVVTAAVHWVWNVSFLLRKHAGDVTDLI